MTRLNSTLDNEFKWFSELVSQRIKELNSSDLLNKRTVEIEDLKELKINDLEEGKDIYNDLGCESQWDIVDRILILLALSPYLYPQILKKLNKNLSLIEKQTGFLFRKKDNSTLILTYKVALFLLTGKNKRELDYLYIVQDDYKLFRGRVLEKNEQLLDLKNAESKLDLPLLLNEEFLEQITTGKPYQPDFSSRFPARKLTTHYTWGDLELEERVFNQVKDMALWMKNLSNITSNKKLGKEIKGYKSILYGPPGTGKSMTVRIIGKELGKTVYRIDLSMVVSKYIGETEKNLSHVFDLAEKRDWILFFDEGDALFGKRSQTKSAQDRYANQEVSYLLQRMEEHPGIIILATNKIKNIDEAFLRRFQTQIYFPKADFEQRLNLWKKAYSDEYQLEDPVILTDIAKKYEVSGAQILNIKHYSIVKTIENGSERVKTKNVMKGLRKELEKNGYTL